MPSRPDCIFETHQLWQSGFSRVYSNCCCSCWFEPEIIKIGQSSLKIYSNYILKISRVYDNFKYLYKKKSGNLLKAPLCLAKAVHLLSIRYRTLIYPIELNGISYMHRLCQYYSTWTLTKRIEKNLDGNFTRILRNNSCTATYVLS